MTVDRGIGRPTRDRAAVRSFERAVLGAPVVPPGRAAGWASAVRRRLAGLNRWSAPPPLRVLEALFASFDTHVLRALIELDIPDLLTEPSTVESLAHATGCDPDRLDRLVRFAAGRGFVGFDRRGRVTPTRVTAALRSDAPAPWRGWVRFVSSDWFDAAWRHLTPSLATGARSAFVLAHGAEFFEHTTAVDPLAGEAFDQAMAAGATLHGIALARSLDWSEVRSVCDVGGGTGAALDVLARYHPDLRTTLFDLPAVIERTDPGPTCGEVVGGSFFDEVPPGHDRYLLLAIVHDWDEDQAATILGNVVDAMDDDGEAVVVETVATDRPRDDFAAMSDIMMFVLASGQERTGDHYRRLFDAAGLYVHDEQLLLTGATAFTLRRSVTADLPPMGRAARAKRGRRSNQS